MPEHFVHKNDDDGDVIYTYLVKSVIEVRLEKQFLTCDNVDDTVIS